LRQQQPKSPLKEKYGRRMEKQNHVDNDTVKLIAQNFCNTEMGLIRISKNLFLFKMTQIEIINHCRKIIESVPVDKIEIRGENYYLYSDEFSAVLTINRSRLGIITAK
jgi:Protein of unknown function (DUF3781)